MEIFKLFGSILVDNDEANKSISKTDKQAEGLGNKFVNGIKTAAKWGAAIAVGAGVAAVAIGGMAAPLVKAAANAQALTAQFEQVFGDVQEDAQKTINQLGKDFGMLPNRIKPAMTQMTSMFKGLGMDTDKAMGTAKDAVTLVADAAAFYDKSFEDANSALNSFIKGNYEGGESIGLFANETQLAAYASKELGLDWKKLDEAGKQVARLEYAKAMQESAGATGQAARESNSLENQLGNLRQAWEDIKARFGEPILGPAVSMIQKLAEWLVNVNVQPIIDGFSAFVDFIDTNVASKFGNLLPFIMSIIDGLKSYFSVFVEYIKGLFSGEGNVGESFKRMFEVIKAVAIPILQDAISFIKGILDNLKQFWSENGQQITQAVKNLFSFIASTVEFFMPLVKFIIEDAWNAIKNVFNGALNVIMGLIKVFAGLFTGDFSKMWEGIKQVFFGAIEAVWGILQLSLLGKVFKVIKTFGGKALDALKSPFEKAANLIKGQIDRIKGFFNGIKLKLPDIKTPHFKLKNWSINPLDWLDKKPSIGIDWYAKGAVFTQPTIFNTPGGLKGFGEAGPEAALPLNDSVLGMIGKMIAQTMPQQTMDLDQLVQAIMALANRAINLQIDGKTFIQATGDYIDADSGMRIRRNDRGLA